jgi:RimJ/RimL family protein N-acetyltransferase
VTDLSQAVHALPVERADALDNSARVELRPLSETDEALYCSLYTDAETMALIGAPLSTERAARSFRTVLRRSANPTDSQHFYAIVEKETQTVVGICGQQRVDATKRRVELGMMLSSLARSRGYSPEAFAAAIDMTFAALPIDTVWVQYHPANAAAGRLCDRLGFVPYADERADSIHPSIVRCVQRSKWHRTDTVNKQGKTNVERDQLF